MAFDCMIVTEVYDSKEANKIEVNVATERSLFNKNQTSPVNIIVIITTTRSTSFNRFCLAIPSTVSYYRRLYLWERDMASARARSFTHDNGYTSTCLSHDYLVWIMLLRWNYVCEIWLPLLLVVIIRLNVCVLLCVCFCVAEFQSQNQLNNRQFQFTWHSLCVCVLNWAKYVNCQIGMEVTYLKRSLYLHFIWHFSQLCTMRTKTTKFTFFSIQTVCGTAMLIQCYSFFLSRSSLSLTLSFLFCSVCCFFSLSFNIAVVVFRISCANNYKGTDFPVLSLYFQWIVFVLLSENKERNKRNALII